MSFKRADNILGLRLRVVSVESLNRQIKLAAIFSQEQSVFACQVKILQTCCSLELLVHATGGATHITFT